VTDGRDSEERRRAFTGLLAHPVLDRARHPELFALVRHPRHRPVLIDWFAARLGYRLVVTDTAARLFRLPVSDTVIAPRRLAPPPRRALVLAVLAAAAAEDAEEVTTTQDLSDRVRALTRHEAVELAPYDPDRFSERQLFGRAVQLLVEAGPLRPADRAAEDRREGWAHRRDAVGGAYQVDRELLLRMVEPAALAAALGQHRDEPEQAARFGLMRRLLELPVCLLADLTDAQRQYLTGQRHRVAAWCHEMTGWTLEQRAEGLALIADAEDDTDVPFPRLRAVDFATLMVLEQLQGAAGVIPDVRLDAAVAEVRARYPRAMTKELATDLQLRERAVELLRALDLLRPVDGGWWLSPAAARYRNPEVVAVTSRLEAGLETGEEP
jgi:uncharacterized protein (TIGR02678 family)